jgi:two-component system chemotaxis response regulator CheY
MERQADIRDLRVLIVGGRPANVQILRTAFGLIGLRHLFVFADSARAIEALRLQYFGAVFCDATADPFDGMAFPLAARRAPGVLNPMTPLFLIYTQARQRHVEEARDIGVTDVLTHPICASTIANKLSAAIQAPRPFIVAPGFFGPDRRIQRGVAYTGRERRKRFARKTRVTLGEARPGDVTLI